MRQQYKEDPGRFTNLLNLAEFLIRERTYFECEHRVHALLLRKKAFYLMPKNSVFPCVLQALPEVSTQWDLACGGILNYIPNGLPRDQSGRINYTDVMADFTESMIDFTGLTLQEAKHAFFIGRQKPSKYGGKILNLRSEPHEVGENIISLLGWIIP